MINQIFKQNDYITTQWVGGSTTQLYIYPKDSLYSNRNFDIRISSATITQSPSEFTLLPGFSRILILLDGSIEISHNNNKPVKLDVFEKHFFNGDWQTHSVGLATDFNVIFSNKIQTDVEVVNGVAKSLQLCNNENTQCFIYIHSGEIDINGEFLSSGQSILIKIKTKVYFSESCNAIIVKFKML